MRWRAPTLSSLDWRWHPAWQRNGLQSGSQSAQVLEDLAEREGFYFRLYLQVSVMTTLPRYYAVFKRVTSESDLRLLFLQFPQFAAFPTKTVSLVSVALIGGN